MGKKIKLGALVLDRVTGMKGIVTSRLEYLNGCIQYGVKPKMESDGKYPDTQYIDVAQLEVIKKEKVKLKKKPTGGDMDPPKNGLM